MQAPTVILSAYLIALTVCTLNAYCQEKKISRLVISGESLKNNPGEHLISAHKNALVLLTGQDSKLEADDVSFDEQTQILTAIGNVRITRQGDVSTSPSFVFRITSSDYLVIDSQSEFVDMNGVPFPAIPFKTGKPIQNKQFCGSGPQKPALEQAKNDDSELEKIFASPKVSGSDRGGAALIPAAQPKQLGRFILWPPRPVGDFPPTAPNGKTLNTD